MATIRITDLKLRTIIGIDDWERKKLQDIVINIKIDFDATKACMDDAIVDTIDYKALTKRVIKEVEGSNFFLLEKLAKLVMDIVMDEPLAQKVRVRVDKPFALRFADSVSVTLIENRKA